MVNPPDVPPSNVCASCGQPLRPGARFCSNCGTRVAEAQPAAASTPAPPAPPAVPQPLERPVASAVPRPSTPPAGVPATPASSPQPGQYQVTLQVVAPLVRARVLQTLRQVLGVDPRTAQAYIAAAPVLLAVGLTADMAERLRQALIAAGAVVLVQESRPSQPSAPAAPPEPPPEPIRRLEMKSKTIKVLAMRPGWRTVTGLDLGRTYSYVSYARAEGQKLVTQADLVRFEAQTAVPSAIRLAGEGRAMSFGSAALDDWTRQPETVHVGFMEGFGVDDGAVLAAVRSFLEALARRVVEVSGPAALAGGEGASTALGVPASWDEKRSELLMETAIQAGFSVNRIVPQPIAALVHHQQQGTLRATQAKQKTMVVDWGGSGLRISFIEHGGDLPKPQLFEHIEQPLGGDWFDGVLLNWLVPQLPSELTDEDQRSLTLFVRTFKDQLSRSLAQGKTEHTQYCVVPAGAPPIRIRLSRAEFEPLTAEARQQFQAALTEAVSTIGLKPEHIEHVILVGGGGGWYFVREAVRSTLGQVPLIGPRPEQAIARGLAVYGLTF